MNDKMEFLDILASTLHDTKNSLGMLSNTLAEIIDHCKDRDDSLYREFNTLQYEIKRLNHNQIRLLSLYKAEKSQFTINIDYHSVSECIEEVVLQNEPILSSKGIDIEMDCSDALFWAFDRSLICGILDNVLNNAFRYTKDKVRVSSKRDGEYLLLRLEDNGSGYPDCMLISDRDGSFHKKTIDFNTGSTGLGLYFSILVAKSHVNKEKKGYISIVNGGDLGGGVFTLFIP